FKEKGGNCQAYYLNKNLLNAVIGVIRPLHLHGVVADLLDLPGANVADLPIILVVPSLSWDGVSYGLAQLNGTGRGQRVEYGEIACSARAIRIGHHGIENLPIDGIVIAAECLARACTSLVDCG